MPLPYFQHKTNEFSTPQPEFVLRQNIFDTDTNDKFFVDSDVNFDTKPNIDLISKTNLHSAFDTPELYSIPTDLSVQNIDAIMQFIISYANKKQNLSVEVHTLNTLVPLLKGMENNTYDPREFNALIQQLRSTAGINFLLNVITDLYIQQQDELLKNTLKLFYPIPPMFNADQIFYVQNLMNVALMDNCDTLVAAFFGWCKIPILAGKFPGLYKEIFLINEVLLLIDFNNPKEYQAFVSIAFSFSSEAITRALKNETRPSTYEDPTLLEKYLIGEGSWNNKFEEYQICKDIPRGWNFIFTFEGISKSLVIRSRTHSRNVILAFFNFIQGQTLTHEQVRRIADFIANFPTQGILAGSVIRGHNIMAPNLQGDKTTVSVTFNLDNTITTMLKSSGNPHFILSWAKGALQEQVSMYILIKYIFEGSFEKNRGIASFIEAQPQSHIKTEKPIFRKNKKQSKG